MRTALAQQAIQAAADDHIHGHICADGKWYNPRVGTRSRCQTLAHLDTASEQVTRLSQQVHQAAHNDEQMRTVAAAMISTPFEELHPEHAEAWLHIARLGVEALAAILDGIPDPQPSPAPPVPNTGT